MKSNKGIVGVYDFLLLIRPLRISQFKVGCLAAAYLTVFRNKNPYHIIYHLSLRKVVSLHFTMTCGDQLMNRKLIQEVSVAVWCGNHKLWEFNLQWLVGRPIQRKPIQEVSVGGSRAPLAGHQLLVEPGVKRRAGQGEGHSIISGSTFAVQVQDTRNSTR